MKKVMKTILTHLTRFAAFTATECAVLFGLPALAEHHPFILFAVSLSVLILVTIANLKMAKETNKALATHRRTVQHPHTHKAA